MDQAILIDLDSLLDTRIATLSRINSDSAVKAVTSKDYYIRLNNDFTSFGVSLQSFREAYAKRDVETLKESLPSSAIFLVNIMVRDLAEQHVSSPFADKVKIVINTYPYLLAKEESLAIARALAGLTDIRHDNIETVSLSWETLTPEVIKARYTGMLFYNFQEWLDCQKDNFLKTKIPQILILAPALYLDRIPEQKEATIEGAEHMTPFEITEGMLAGCFDLHFLSSQQFSLVPPEALGTPIIPTTFKTK